MFHDMMRQARSLGVGIEAVLGSAPGWEQPWSRVRRLEVAQGAREYQVVLIDERDVQLARLETAIH